MTPSLLPLVSVTLTPYVPPRVLRLWDWREVAGTAILNVCRQRVPGLDPFLPTLTGTPAPPPSAPLSGREKVVLKEPCKKVRPGSDRCSPAFSWAYGLLSRRRRRDPVKGSWTRYPFPVFHPSLPSSSPPKLGSRRLLTEDLDSHYPIRITFEVGVPATSLSPM